MIKRSNLYVLTFLGVFLSLVLAGAILSPLLLHFIRTTYLSMSADTHKHEAKIVAQIIYNLIHLGQPENAVVQAIQKSLENTEETRGYICLVDENTGTFLAHPIANLVGKSLQDFNANFLSNLPLSKPMGLTAAIKGKKVDFGGLLTMPNGTEEIVNSFLVPFTNIRVFSHENIKRLNHEIAKLQTASIIAFILIGFFVAFPASYAAYKVSRRYESVIEEEQAKSERLLLNILPQSIAKRLKAEETNIANRYEDVSVLFVDMVDFTPLAAQMSPEQLVEILSYIFSQFDAISIKHGLEKIKTMGDAYMVAGGIPEFKENHLTCSINAGLEMMAFIQEEFSANIRLHVRIGLHAGPVVAGVIGTHKFTYDLWGETVNIAARLESTSLPSYIHCSEEVYNRMKNDFHFTPREKILLKGMGEVSTYFLVP